MQVPVIPNSLEINLTLSVDGFNFSTLISDYWSLLNQLNVNVILIFFFATITPEQHQWQSFIFFSIW